MKSSKGKTIKRAICYPVIAILLAVLIVANYLAFGMFNQMITDFLCGTGDSFTGAEVEQSQKLGDELCKELELEGAVLLRNENNALPLKATSPDEKIKVNVFGTSSADKFFLLKGVGSGSSTINEQYATTLTQGLEEAGFELNPTLVNKYKNASGSRNNYDLAEIPVNNYSDAEITGAKEFSDIAIFVLSRNGGENIGEMPRKQKVNGSDDYSRTYLEISKVEEEVLELVRSQFGTVIVLLNTCNNMHVGFLETMDVDAALYVGLTGQSGTTSIGNLLRGYTFEDGKEKTPVSPSGKLADTYVYNDKCDPSFENYEAKNSSVMYQDNIYFGYKWYETAAQENFYATKDTTYDKVVQYPFGFGLSYTTFSWELKEVSVPAGSEFTKDTVFTFKVDVTNTGNYVGKDVVQLYVTVPYIKGGIEKAHVTLTDFAKTAWLNPGQTQELTLTCTPYSFASYDCYDKNTNNHTGYELDAGKYTLKLMRDAHNVAVDESNTAMEYEYTLAETYNYNTDPVTGTAVENQFTGETAYAGVPADGSTANLGLEYLSRADFAGTFATKHSNAPADSATSKAAQFTYSGYNGQSMPKMGQDNGLYLVTEADGSKASKNALDGKGGAELTLNMDLINQLASNYDDPLWEDLLNQISANELKKLVECSGFRIQSMASVGKPLQYDYDGPAGFNRNTLTGNLGSTSSTDFSTDGWTAYTSETVIGCTWNKDLALKMGLSMGVEAAATNCNGWYAPGVNLHRSAYTARNYEYYSEDAVISGKLAAEVIKGAKTNGLYCYIKHFIMSELGNNAREINTWTTEQAIRECYLKPFEIAVKEGGANAIMSAFNDVGGVWCGANYAMCTTILRGEWGFRGSILTDWSTGGGTGTMNPVQGVRAGNDIWLNPSETISGAISTSNATDMYCARIAAHNVLYTYVDTLAYADAHDAAEFGDRFSVQVGIKQKDTVFAWWQPILIVFDVLAFGGLVVWGVFLALPNKKKSENTAN